MNANELADDLDHVYELSNIFECKAGADTIRQQQAEIELLKANMNSATKELLQQQDKIAELKHMNRNWQISENILLLELEKLQHRELTDEEITQVFDECYPNNADGDVVTLVDFARAILRKAHSNCNGFCGEYECKENQAGCKRKASEK